VLSNVEKSPSLRKAAGAPTSGGSTRTSVSSTTVRRRVISRRLRRSGTRDRVPPYYVLGQSRSTAPGIRDAGSKRPVVFTAYYDEGTIAVLAFPDASETRVRVGCEQPTTRKRCEALLRRISVGK
jgi:hypothetical protein